MAHFTREFDSYAQFLVNRGYIVIQPNVRGSTGYGTAFRDMADMDWGGGNLEDLVYAAKYLHTLPEVDPQRIGIWGGSYGGYLTYMAVTKKPEFWKVGVAWVGITDLLKNYASGSEHYKHFTRTQMGDPQEHEELWRDRSPINFVHHMTAHLMILHGVNDPRCAIEQARIFRDRLRELGKIEGEDFEYHEFTDEGHGSVNVEQKLRTYILLVDYLDRRL
jgi:dipeptidyl aminopeptidase/acylaminoacyl peptidase